MKRTRFIKPLAGLAGLALIAAPAMSQTISQLTADGQTFDAYFTDFDGKEWLLIGRGRQGWEFDTDGQGAVGDVSQNVGTTAAFTPACYSDAIINDLLDQAGITDMANVTMRLSRASDATGTVEFQDVRWTAFTGNGGVFTWNIEDSQYGVTAEYKNAPAGLPGATIATYTGSNTRDGNHGNDARRIFTWAWGGHSNQKGFSYGQSVNAGTNSATNFLWESGSESHSIPYTEVYIPYSSGPDETAPVIDTRDPDDDATGVYPGAALVANFSEKIALTGIGTITVTDGSDSRVVQLDGTADDGDASILDKVLTITLDTNLTNFGATYDVLISSDAIVDLATIPNAFAGTVAGDWNFTTAAADGTAPVLAAVDPLDPADEAAGVLLDTNLSVTFDEDILVNSSATQVEIFSEDFETTTPGMLPADWAAGKNPADNSSLTNWELGTPANVGPVPPGVPLPSGANCVATNIMGNYDDPVTDLGIAHTDIWLRTPAIDLGAAVSATLTFQQWTQIEDVPGDLDYGSIRILDASDDSVLATLENQTIDGSTTGWEEYTMALPAAAFTATAGTIKVEWQLEADDIDSFAGWYIDDVLVTTVDANSVITLKDLTNVTDTIIPINDSSQVSVSGATLTINPTATMAPMANYAVQIGPTAVRNYNDLNFAGIADTTTWNFATTGPVTLTWDPAGGGTSDGAGTWLDSGKWWSGTANVDWANSTPDNAIIGNGGAGGTITLGAVNAGTVVLDNFTGTYTLNGTSLDQSGGITVGATAGNVTVGAAVTGTGGITINGPSRVNLRGTAKPFTGDLVVGGGGEALDDDFIGIGTGNLNLNGGAYVNYWSDTFTRTLGTGAGEVQVPGGESGFCGQGRSGLSVRLNNNDSFVVQWGDPLFNPSTLLLQTPWANTNGKLTFRNKLDLNGAPRTIKVNKDHLGATDGYAQISNEISNSDAGNPSGLTKTGPGRLILSATNTYDGGTNVNEGIMYYQRADSMPPTGNVAFAADTELEVDVGGSGDFTDAASGAGSLGGLLAGTGGSGGTVSYAGDIAMKWYVSGTLNYGGPISVAGGDITNLWIRGNSTLTLSGTASYTGPTRIGAPGSATTVLLGSSTALPNGNPLTVDSSGVSKLDLNGNDATIGLLSLGSNNGGARGQVLDTAGGGTLTLTNGVFCDDHNNGAGGIYADTVDLNGTTQTFSVRDSGSVAVDLEVTSALQNGGLTFDAVEANAGLELAGACTYTGGTDVSGGTLTVSGSLGDASMTISGGTVQGGSGTLTFNVAGATVDQIVMTGGTLDASALTVNISGTLTETEYVLVDATGGGSITTPFVGLTGAPGYALDYGTANQVKLVGTPGGSPYESWAGGELFDDDKNGDGVANGLAFLLGAADPDANALGLLPASNENGSGGLVMTFSMLNLASRGAAVLNVEHSSDLGIGDPWTSVVVPDADGGPTLGVTFVVTPGNPTNSVTATIASSESAGGKLFGRLVAEE